MSEPGKPGGLCSTGADMPTTGEKLPAPSPVDPEHEARFEALLAKGPDERQDTDGAKGEQSVPVERDMPPRALAERAPRSEDGPGARRPGREAERAAAIGRRAHEEAAEAPQAGGDRGPGRALSDGAAAALSARSEPRVPTPPPTPAGPETVQVPPAAPGPSAHRGPVAEEGHAGHEHSDDAQARTGQARHDFATASTPKASSGAGSTSSLATEDPRAGSDRNRRSDDAEMRLDDAPAASMQESPSSDGAGAGAMDPPASDAPDAPTSQDHWPDPEGAELRADAEPNRTAAGTPPAANPIPSAAGAGAGTVAGTGAGSNDAGTTDPAGQKRAQRISRWSSKAPRAEDPEQSTPASATKLDTGGAGPAGAAAPGREPTRMEGTSRASSIEDDTAIVARLADRILVSHVKQRDREVRIRLHPDTLGGAEISLKHDANGLTIEFTSDKLEVAQQVDGFAEALAEHMEGFTSEPVRVEAVFQQGADDEGRDGHTRNRQDPWATADDEDQS